ncbi:MAG: 2-isopropylmalate synthase, partial [Candidatus Methanomethylophilaceae archaeon]|nr:2-isopropylmalate synthase [Candidatus Methanomethylophilaceae archaeon]
MTEDWKDRIIRSPINGKALNDVRIGSVRLFDTTLRDGIQAPGITLDSDDMVSLAKSIDELDLDSMEIGFPASGESEIAVIKRMIGLGLKSKLYGLARCIGSDIDAVAECGLKYTHIFIATSDVHLEYKLKKTREDVLKAVKDTVSYASSKGLHVMFSCEDATRTDLDYLKSVYKTAVEA